MHSTLMKPRDEGKVVRLSSQQLAFPTTPHHWSIGMLLSHMISARVAWFHLRMGEGNPDFVHWNEDGQPVLAAQAEHDMGLCAI